MQGLSECIGHSINYSIAAAIRREHASGKFNLERFSHAMRDFPENFRVNFSRSFPQLFVTFTNTLNADQQRQFRELFVPVHRESSSASNPDA
jgi:hypothetical protein